MADFKNHMLAEAFDESYEWEVVTKGKSDVRYRFTASDGTEYELRFRNAAGFSTDGDVRRVTLRQKQGATYKDAFKRVDKPMQVLATFIDASMSYRRTHQAGKSAYGLILDFSTKAMPRATQLVKKVLPRSKLKRRWVLVDTSEFADSSPLWLVRKGYSVQEIFDGPKANEVRGFKDDVPDEEDDDIFGTSDSAEDKAWQMLDHIINEVVVELDLEPIHFGQKPHETTYGLQDSYGGVTVMDFRSGQLTYTRDGVKYEDDFMPDFLKNIIYALTNAPDSVNPQNFVAGIRRRVGSISQEWEKHKQDLGLKDVADRFDDDGSESDVSPKGRFKDNMDGFDMIAIASKVRRHITSNSTAWNSDLSAQAKVAARTIPDLMDQGLSIEKAIAQATNALPSREKIAVRADILRAILSKGNLADIVKWELDKIGTLKLPSDRAKRWADSKYYNVNGEQRQALARLYDQFGVHLDDLQVMTNNKGRARYNLEGGIEIGKNSDTTTIWHEVGHFLEDTMSSLMRSSSDMLIAAYKEAADKNGGGDKAIKTLNEILGSDSYSNHEITFDSKYFSDYYTQKIYNMSIMTRFGNVSMSEDEVDEYMKQHTYATEVLSMGLQCMHSPSLATQFALRDPRHYEYTLRVLKRYKAKG